MPTVHPTRSRILTRAPKYISPPAWILAVAMPTLLNEQEFGTVALKGDGPISLAHCKEFPSLFTIQSTETLVAS